MKWLPPNRPSNESAGYLGWYTRTHLPVEFDLVDWDGTGDPVVWFWWKQRNRTFRIVEEKPLKGNWRLHSSEERILRDPLVAAVDLLIKEEMVSDWSGVYVLQGADQLIEAKFPVSVIRLGRTPSDDKGRIMEQSDFDEWLLCNGSVER